MSPLLLVSLSGFIHGGKTVATNVLAMAYRRLGMPAGVRVHAERCGICGRALATANQSGKCFVRCVADYTDAQRSLVAKNFKGAW